jgi:hypothetical protein
MLLLLPPAAIREYKGLYFVIVQDGERRRRVEINEIGLKSQPIGGKSSPICSLAIRLSAPSRSYRHADQSSKSGPIAAQVAGPGCFLGYRAFRACLCRLARRGLI